MNKIEEALLETKKNLKKNKNIFAAILFGSVARGDYSLRHSDIDILILLKDLKNKKEIDKIIDNINIKYRVKIHQEYQTSSIEKEDETLLYKMFEEGKVLFSRGIWFMDYNNLGLDTFRLYRFDTTALSKVDRVMFSRALHGRKGFSGIIDNISVIDSGKGGLLVRKNMFKQIEQVFDRFKVKFKVVKTLYG